MPYLARVSIVLDRIVRGNLRANEKVYRRLAKDCREQATLLLGEAAVPLAQDR
jgi:hypothetical protein